MSVFFGKGLRTCQSIIQAYSSRLLSRNAIQSGVDTRAKNIVTQHLNSLTSRANKRNSYKYSTQSERGNGIYFFGAVAVAFSILGLSKKSAQALEPASVIKAVGNATLENTLGQFEKLIDHVFDRIQETIAKKRVEEDAFADSVYRKTLSLEMEAGLQVRLAIENCKNAYADSLDLTIDKLSSEMQTTLEMIKQLVDDLMTPQVEVLEGVADRVENLIMRLPLVDKSPSVLRSTPRFIAPSTVNNVVLVRFFGHFPKDQNIKATFTMDGHTFSAEGGVKEILCKVPSKHFYPNDEQLLSRSSLVEGELVLTRDVGWLFSSIITNKYKIWIVRLPSSPGEVSVEYVKKTSIPKTKPFVSQEFFQSSGEKGGGLTILNREYAVHAEDGWEVLKGSSRLIEIEKRPKHYLYSFVRDDKEKVIYQVTTTHVPKKGDSGQIRFKIEFTQQKMVETEQPISEPLSLKWKETKVIDETDRKLKKVVFTAFDGTRYEMAGASSNNPFIKIRNQRGQLVLEVVAPESLSFFSSVSDSKQ
jgi:hypothetical protein